MRSRKPDGFQRLAGRAGRVVQDAMVDFAKWCGDRNVELADCLEAQEMTLFRAILTTALARRKLKGQYREVPLDEFHRAPPVMYALVEDLLERASIVMNQFDPRHEYALNIVMRCKHGGKKS